MKFRITGTLVFLIASSIAFLPHETIAGAPSLAVENKVREFFKDAPVMVEIARCESNFRQFDTLGNALKGGYQNGMVGVFQLYDTIHRSSARQLGFDISTLEGNLAYARHLFENSGTVPWNSSRACWKDAVTSVKQKVLTQQEREQLQVQVKSLLELVQQLTLLLEQKKLSLRQ